MKTGKALIEEIKEYKSEYGTCAFWWLGQLGYIVKAGDAVLAIDPYLNPSGARLIPPILDPEDLTIADYILGSHNHGDHIDHYTYSALWEVSKEAMFVIPEFSKNDVSSKLEISKDNLIGLTEGTQFKDDSIGLTITGIAAAHEFLDKDSFGNYQSLGFIIDVNGVRIYHSGDTCKYDGLEKKLLEYAPIDIMFVPINGRDGKKYRSLCIGNMNFAESVDLCGMVKPTLAVPGHYEMFSNNSANPIDFVDFMEAKYPDQKMWIGGHGIKVELEKS